MCLHWKRSEFNRLVAEMWRMELHLCAAICGLCGICGGVGAHSSPASCVRASLDPCFPVSNLKSRGNLIAELADLPKCSPNTMFGTEPFKSSSLPYACTMFVF